MKRQAIDLRCTVLGLMLFGIGTCAAAQDLAITHLRLYPAPGAAPVDDTTILIRGGRVAAVGTGIDTGSLLLLAGEGRAATAGLWNSHVHFMDPALADDPAAVISEMLLRYGFTSVVDTGSVPSDTLRLAADIAAGRISGPRIVLAAGGLVSPAAPFPAGLGPLVATALQFEWGGRRWSPVRTRSSIAKCRTPIALSSATC